MALRLPGDSAGWYGEVRDALRTSTVAVEARLQSLAGPQGMELDITREHPRLIPDLERLEASLARLLIDFWEAKGEAAAKGPGFAPRVEALLRDMRTVAADEFALVHETFNEPGGQE